MKTIALLCVMLSGACLAQNVQGKRVSLELGTVTVYLGMPKAELLKQFEAKGIKVVVNNGDYVSFNDVPETHSYLTKFAQGKLTFASRNWVSGKGALEDEIWTALAAFSQYGDRCSVSSDPLRTPDESLERIYITCGTRSLLFFRGTIMGNRMLELNERIQTLEP